MQPAALALIFDQGKLLLVKRQDVPVWVLPGGGIDPGEAPKAAAAREVKEESGFEVLIKGQAALYHPVNSLASTTYIYKGEILSGKAALSEESCEVAFFPLDQLPKNLFYIHKGWIEELTGKSDTLIERNLYEVNYLRLILYLLRHPITFFRFILTRALS